MDHSTGMLSIETAAEALDSGQQYFCLYGAARRIADIQLEPSFDAHGVSSTDMCVSTQ